MKTFKLDEQSKKVLNNNIVKQLHLKEFNYGMLSDMVAQSLDIDTISPKSDEQAFPSDGGRAGVAFKELAKLGLIKNIPGYAHFSYDQSFLRMIPTHLAPEHIDAHTLEGV